VTACKGFFANGIAAGIKSNGRKDICIIFSREPCDAAAVFTTNRIKAAPIRVSKPNLAKKIHAIICNSGNANACTGREGLKNCRTMVKRVSEEFEFPSNSILVASTGIIGHQLPMETVNYGITKLHRKMIAESNVNNAVDAIMTTDTRRKMAKVTCLIGDKQITIGGIAKGSGMINPNMATMLAFLTSDVSISRTMMQRALRFAVKHTFNKITVDGEMSTNDTVYLLANGTANNPLINRPGQKYSIFEHALTRLCEVLAMEIVNDGEGVTKVITITVKGATRKPDAEKVARSIGNSPLVKTAIYGQLANWGRVLQAIGASGVAIDPDRIGIMINGTLVCENGVSCGVTLLEGRQLLNRRNIELVVDLGQGSSSDFVITTDLTYDYVKINSQKI
jgi:glutamate N-acetyltransferase/amino-acid N-acetyltransferase